MVDASDNANVNIPDLEALAKAAEEVPFANIGRVLKGYSGNDWIHFAESETRTGLIKKRIYASPSLEILFLSWPKSYSTLPHDHAANGCWLKVMTGQLQETRYNTEFEPTQSTCLRKGDISFMSNNLGYHAISSLELTWSLHVYSPPFHKTQYFQK